MREHTVLHKIEAEFETVPIRKRRNGIRPRDLLAIEHFVEGYELTWLEMELLHLGHAEQEMVDLRRQFVRRDQLRLHAGCPSLANAWLARSSNASSSAGCPSSG